MPRNSTYRPNQINVPPRSGHRRSRSPRRQFRRTPSPPFNRRTVNGGNERIRSPIRPIRNRSPRIARRSPSPPLRIPRRSPSPKRITRPRLPSVERQPRRHSPTPPRRRYGRRSRSKSPRRPSLTRNRRNVPDSHRPRRLSRSPRRTNKNLINDNSDTRQINLKHEKVETTKGVNLPIVNQLNQSKELSDEGQLSPSPPTIKSLESDINDNLSTINSYTTIIDSINHINLEGKSTEMSPKSLSSPKLYESISSIKPISNARIDMIDFIIKCCLRLQLPMTTITCALKTYHKYQHYLDQGTNRWLIESVDWRFDEELIAIACILLVTKNTEYFQGVRKTLNIGWSLKYPKSSLDEDDIMKDSVKIIMTNIKNAIGIEILSNDTPFNSASRILKFLIERSEQNINSDYTLWTKLTQDVWAMISNCLSSTKIMIKYNSDVFATAVTYLSACNIGVDLQAHFAEFCKDVGNSDPLTVNDAIVDMLEFKISVDTVETTFDSNV
ncbi:6212_t:CDS:2 [Diversispora eburnea]|uniref:6212_t:CDS:1 n=1 Tax=Diversispora eburnea TaxID=1213867 RepID=A0A9N8V2Z7_9GLOM|nr:6212_t:CDS:2 [Diversispora eburnea]